MGAKREPQRRWHRKLAAAACALALATLALRLAASRPGAAQHWLASVNLEQRAGVPRRCGSDGRATYAWMNPVQFNRTFTRARGTALFLVGCGHSGTTPLTALLQRHPGVFVYAPSADLEYAIKPDSFSPLLGSSQNDRATLDRLARGNAWLVKSPSNVCRLGYILMHVPSARVVALVRDGRDVMLSLMERYPDADPAGDLCLGRWVHDNTALLLYERDPRLLIERYEDLFEGAPRYPSLRRILGHYGVTYENVADLMARPASDAHGSTSAKASAAHTRLRAQQVSKPLRTAAPRWPAELSPALKRTFKRDKAAVRLLVRFGYANDSNW